MELKYTVIWTVLGCCVWALIISCIAGADEFGDLQYKSELPSQTLESKFGDSPVDQFASIIKVLNFALPIALCGIIFLGVTNSNNPVGLAALVAIIVLFGFTVSKTMDAADIIQAKSEFSIDARVWWW